ncbi:MAG: hypothetical protein ABIV50_13720 [Opitutus sp.]
MDTLYVLCRSVDRRTSHHLDEADVTAAVAQKESYLAAEAKVNPLVHEILSGGSVTLLGGVKHDAAGFLNGPPSFFRTYEMLRKTRRSNAPLCVGRREYSHDEVAAMFVRCVPNAKLAHVPWCSLGRYRISLGLAWGATLLTAHFSARAEEGDPLLDPFVLYYMGSITTVAALVYTTLKQNRDVRHAAPWNSAMYLDLNADLVRRKLPTVAVARKEAVPQEKPLKTLRFYYDVARKIETHAFDAELNARLAAATGARKSAVTGAVSVVTE